MGTITEAERGAWDYVHGWAARTRSDRVKHTLDEDAVFVAANWLDVERRRRTDGFVGRVTFTALGDIVNVALYDPQRIIRGVTHQRPDGMPMQGWLSTQRSFENDTSDFHVGVDGELYRPGAEQRTVRPEPLDVLSKLTVFSYFQARVNVALASA